MLAPIAAFPEHTHSVAYVRPLQNMQRVPKWQFRGILWYSDSAPAENNSVMLVSFRVSENNLYRPYSYLVFLPLFPVYEEHF